MPLNVETEMRLKQPHINPAGQALLERIEKLEKKVERGQMLLEKKIDEVERYFLDRMD